MSWNDVAAQGPAEDSVRAKTTIREVFVRLWPHFMRQKAMFFGTMLAVLGVAVLSRLTIMVLGRTIDEGILKADRDWIVMAVLLYFVLEVTVMVMEFLHTYLFARLGNRVLFDLRAELVQHVQSLPISYFDKHPSGRIVTRLTNDVVSMGEMFTQGLISVFAATVSMIAILVAMLMISWKATLATMLIAPPLVYIIVVLSNRILVALRETKGKLAAINAFVAENIGGMRILQLYGRVGRNSERFNALSGEYRDAQLKTVRLYAMLWPVTSFFNAASVAVALYASGRLTLDGSVSTGLMVAFILNVRDFIHPIHVILEKYNIFQNSLSGAERVFTMQDEASEERPAPLPPVVRLSGEVNFKDVEFRYREGLPLALDRVTFDVKPGQSVALVGRTGSGKSTTIALLQRLYDVTGGSILIDGRPITSYGRRELRSRIGVVQQDTFMFRGTVAENIGLADPKISRERIEGAAHGARLDEFLASHAGGLEAKVEERGANLSFGERQLIAFARILAFDPDILILDEATANIDSHTEQLIQEATRQVRQGRTSLIIAHRISTIMDCDLIIVLDQGRIVEKGTHAELYERGGTYRQLCNAQFSEHQSEAPRLTV